VTDEGREEGGGEGAVYLQAKINVLPALPHIAAYEPSQEVTAYNTADALIFEKEVGIEDEK